MTPRDPGLTAAGNPANVDGKMPRHEDCSNCAVHAISVFSKVPAETAVRAGGLRDSRVHRRGEVLFTRGERSRFLYCVRSGVVKLVIPGGRDHLVRLVGPGGFLGQNAIHEGVHHLTAKVVEEARICEFPLEDFASLLGGSRELACGLESRLWCDLRTHEENLARMMGKSVRERMALTILGLHRQFGVRVPGGSLINVRITRGDIASLAGTVLESAVRHLSEFKREGLISNAGRRVVVLRPDALARVAGSRIG